MSLLDRLPGRQAARRMEALSEEVASVRTLANSRASTIAHLQQRLDEALPLDQQRGRAGPFVGGHWEEIGASANKHAARIEAAQKAYKGDYVDKAGVARPFSTSRRIVEMHFEFGFAGGVEAPTLNPSDKDTELKKQEEALRTWWLYPPNQETAFDFDSQRRRSAQLLVDGQLYIAVFAPSAGRPMLVRFLDPLQMGTPVVAPDDADKTLYHVRKYQAKRWDVGSAAYNDDGEPQVMYYPDIDIESSRDIENPYAEELAEQIAVDQFGNPIRVLQVGDGYSMMSALMLWEKAFLSLVDDQLTMSSATAAFALWLKVQGAQAQVDQASAYFGQSGNDPTTAPRNAGDVNVANQAVDFTANRASIQAGEANLTRRLVQQPLAVAGGISLHYMGDPENANLATATSMELPQLRHFEAYQGTWTYIYTRLGKCALEPLVEDTSELKVFVPMPKIITNPIMDSMDAIGAMETAGWATKRQSAREAWKAMGAADVSAEVEVAMEEAEAQAEEDAANPPEEQVPGAPFMQVPPAQGTVPPQQATPPQPGANGANPQPPK